MRGKSLSRPTTEAAAATTVAAATAAAVASVAKDKLNKSCENDFEGS